MAKCCWRGVFLVDEVAGCGEPVVEDILLFLEHSLLVPALAVLAAAAHVGNGEVSALLEPPGPGGIPRRCLAEVEAAVASHQQAGGTVLRQAFLAGDEHGDLGAVCRFVEDLLEFVLGGVEGDFGLGKEFAFAGESCRCGRWWAVESRTRS